jgi:hypothetical protein
MFELFGESGTYLNETYTSGTIYKLVPAGQSVRVSNVKIGSTGVKDITANCKIKNYVHMCF